jgi:hypothetical protein
VQNEKYSYNQIEECNLTNGNPIAKRLLKRWLCYAGIPPPIVLHACSLASYECLNWPSVASKDLCVPFLPDDPRGRSPLLSFPTSRYTQIGLGIKKKARYQPTNNQNNTWSKEWKRPQTHRKNWRRLTSVARPSQQISNIQSPSDDLNGVMSGLDTDLVCP